MLWYSHSKYFFTHTCFKMKYGHQMSLWTSNGLVTASLKCKSSVPTTVPYVHFLYGSETRDHYRPDTDPQLKVLQYRGPWSLFNRLQTGCSRLDSRQSTFKPGRIFPVIFMPVSLNIDLVITLWSEQLWKYSKENCWSKTNENCMRTVNEWNNISFPSPIIVPPKFILVSYNINLIF